MSEHAPGPIVVNSMNECSSDLLVLSVVVMLIHGRSLLVSVDSVSASGHELENKLMVCNNYLMTQVMT